jgi:DNA polymerase III alpha subunit
MKTNNLGEIIYDSNDVIDLVMRGVDVMSLEKLTVDSDINVDELMAHFQEAGKLSTWTPASSEQDTGIYDQWQQQQWLMPEEYRDLDIAQHVLSLCESQAELQRCGQELLMFQERDMFDVLKYLKYLVDVMQTNGVIWGVGRGSSVASFVLYKLGVHRVNSLFYDLDPSEFLR